MKSHRYKEVRMLSVGVIMGYLHRAGEKGPWGWLDGGLEAFNGPFATEDDAVLDFQQWATDELADAADLANDMAREVGA